MIDGNNAFVALGPFPLNDVDGVGPAALQSLKTLDLGINQQVIVQRDAADVSSFTPEELFVNSIFNWKIQVRVLSEMLMDELAGRVLPMSYSHLGQLNFQAQDASLRC